MESLPDLYARLVADGTLTRDPAQEALLPEFERMRVAVAELPRKGWFRRSAEPPKGLYIWGGVGRGKSMLMDLFVETLEVPSRRVHFHAFMQEIHAGLHAARARNEQDALAPVAADVAKSVRLLAFDEMQITDITDAMIVGRLFEALFAAGVVVVTTSNRLPDDLYKNGLNRQLFLPFIDLLKERMVIHEMVSPTDYRQDRLTGSPSYFSPINSESRAEIETIWQDLTGARGRPHTIIVNKRAVEIPAFHNGVARATFYDLCGNPLGPADYLALAAAARVLILENIPQMGRSNFNEAKRFVTLIDSLYEARVRLICSAAAVPEYLYIEGEGSFEFERTASRMREMQSEGWGRED
ncbi:cell division protein ZapE [Roseovarius sp. 217]|uniref:cell division protein ZapE n=1 Tax=Roseovarius sp. (strain 217) TaxID=314264 RepID=UPI00006853A1|nr:cell division protein ZapE [Roseovarius sp. 217]EAQ23410.1 ATPase, AFG1 family protein [Roseovarius sp. 217]